MYSKTLTVEQWLSSRKIPRKPEEGGVGRRGQAVTDWSQSHSDQSDSGTIKHQLGPTFSISVSEHLALGDLQTNDFISIIHRNHFISGKV